MLSVVGGEGPAKPAAEEKRRIVSLTDAHPVSILESEWPVIAEGMSGFGGDGAPFDLTVNFRVRQGKHCRYLIHGRFSYWDETRDDAQEHIRVGRMLTVGEENFWRVVQAMREVGKEMLERIQNDKFRKHALLALDRCFEKLPPKTA